MRLEASDASEMINQILFGEVFKVIDQRKKWVKVRLAHDQYEGWVCRKQWVEISEELYKSLAQSRMPRCSELVGLVKNDRQAQAITLGAALPLFESSSQALRVGDESYEYDGGWIEGQQSREKLVEFALSYLNAPYLWGGRSPFGIDCSGFTQMVYQLCGHALKRDAYQQATQGESLSFIEEAQAGDLAFFDNAEGKIIHVGIMLGNYEIVHASGKVRIDKIDHQGIFNQETGQHTHQLRLITRILN